MATRRRAGHVRVPWLLGGRDVELPMLSLGESLEVLHHEVVVLRRLGLTDETPKWERERLEEIANAEVQAEAMYRRMRLADPTLVRERFEAELHGPTDVATLAAHVLSADAERVLDFRSRPATVAGRGRRGTGVGLWTAFTRWRRGLRGSPS